MADIFDRLLKNYGPIDSTGKGAWIFCISKRRYQQPDEIPWKDVIVWSLNNYLGLANHPEVRKGC